MTYDPQISNGPIWVSIDEITDVDGTFIVNIIIGKFNCQYYKILI